MERIPKKIHIIGPSGTGKTTLAKHLSKVTGSTLVELDPLVWLPDAKRRTSKELEPILEEVLNQEGWITEGIYVSGIDKVFEEADQIIWMDLPLHINLPRVTGRFIKNRLVGKDYWGFWSFLKLVRGTIGYSVRRTVETSGNDGDITPAILENFLRPYGNKLVRIKNMKDYDNYLKSFSTAE